MACTRTLIKSAFTIELEKLIFLFLNLNMLWLLKRTVSMRRFFWAPKIYVKTDG